MPRSAEQNEAMRAESRRKIIAAALTLFAQQGYASVSVRQIAEAAGVAQGLLYNYFDSKDELLRAIFERSLEDVQASFAAADAGQDQAQIANLVRAAFASVRTNQQFWRLSYSLRMQAEVLRALAPALEGWTTLILRQLEGYLQAAGVQDAAIGARLLFALIDGAAQHYVLDPENYPLDAVAERISALYDGMEKG